jgi:hypothetical protein
VRRAKRTTDIDLAFIPTFLRMKRTEILSGVETDRQFHANYNCSRDFHQEIRNASVVDDLPELSEQEKRVVKTLVDVINRFGDQ